MKIKYTYNGQEFHEPFTSAIKALNSAKDLASLTTVTSVVIVEENGNEIKIK